MICKNCNREINDKARFCVYCGIKVEEEQVQEIYLEPEAIQPPPQRRRLHPAIIVLIVIGGIQLLAVSVIAIIAVIIAVLNSNVSSNKVTEPDYYYYESDFDDAVVDNLPENDYEEEDYDTEEVYSETLAPVESEQEENIVQSPADTSSRVIIANGGLNMRSGPSTSESVITLIPNGEIVTVDRTENNWAYVYYNGNYGWCSCDYLFTPIEYSGTLLYSAVVRCPGFLEMISYDYPEDSEIFTDVPSGTLVYVYEVRGDRAFVKYNNIYGWCLLEHLELM